MIVEKKLLFPSYQVKRIPPYNLKTEDERNFKHEYEKKFPDVYLWKFKNVNVSEQGIIFKQLKTFPHNLINTEQKKIYNTSYLLSTYLKRKRIKADDNVVYLLVYNNWSEVYFHWISDVLSKLVAVDINLSNYTIILPESYKSNFFRESLIPFSFKNIFTLPTNSYLSVKNLITIDLPAPTGNYHPGLMIQLKEKLLSLRNTLTLKNERVYISRGKADKRKIINEEEVIELLSKKFNFEICYFEDYSYKEQISIAKNAKILVSLHGAGLTNIMFMNKDSFVLELRKNNDFSNNCYFSLANVFSINYCYQFCDYVIHSSIANNFDVTVDINELNNNIEKIINELANQSDFTMQLLS